MISDQDKLIECALNRGEDYWTFEKDAERDYVHNLFTYPAMMVPKMQREILEVFSNNINIERPLTIFDPFMGSGTIIVEGMLQGASVIGVDINPLAYLVVKVKTTIYSLPRLKSSIGRLVKNLEPPINTVKKTDFDNISKWFKEEIINELQHIKNQIMIEPCLKFRRYMWVAFSETIRLVSNSRTCTYKLYIKQKEAINSFNKSAIGIYISCINNNYMSTEKFQNKLLEDGFLAKSSRGYRYINNIDIKLADTLKVAQSLIRT